MIPNFLGLLAASELTLKQSGSLERGIWPQLAPRLTCPEDFWMCHIFCSCSYYVSVVGNKICCDE